MADFNGFHKETVRFFKQLKKNNSTVWFKQHQSDYEEHVKKPAVEFVEAMGKRLLDIAPGIYAIPKVNQSLFRLNRDTRFSPDKTPYKTNMGIWMWEGENKRMENSGFYLHLEDNTVMLGVGLYLFPKWALERYREAVVAGKSGGALPKIVNQLVKGGYSIGGKHYKKVPRGFDKDHKNAEFLLFNGLFAGTDSDVPKEFYSSDLIDYCLKHYRAMLPLHHWLKQHVLE